MTQPIIQARGEQRTHRTSKSGTINTQLANELHVDGSELIVDIFTSFAGDHKGPPSHSAPPSPLQAADPAFKKT